MGQVNRLVAGKINYAAIILQEDYYEGNDAPEGALTYSRLGIMIRTSDGWTCDVTGTGW